MLQLKNIIKTYKSGDFVQQALNNISINFRENEFVAILGPSGSGKTTLLNILGGLDHYTSGDLVINQVSTKNFSDRDFDTYRNHRIGFVFQNYNLISHQSVLSNVECALTLSGVRKSVRRQKAREALIKVGLKDHIHKKPNQLSGGQMQRVAIARALVNDPDILLADEPTGALDSTTSYTILELLKEVAQDKLVIMVTHNDQLAYEYASRIVKLKDGKILDDSDPFVESEAVVTSENTDKKPRMSILMALNLSFNNLLTKKTRTLLTGFAGSIGIIGIALILSLSNGVNNYIHNIQRETLSNYPLEIEENSSNLMSLFSLTSTMVDDVKVAENEVAVNNTFSKSLKFTQGSGKLNNLGKFKEYIEQSTEIQNLNSEIEYVNDFDLLIYNDDVQVNPSLVFPKVYGEFRMSAGNAMAFNVFYQLNKNQEVNENLMTLIHGHWPQNSHEVVIKVDYKKRLGDYVVYSLNLEDQSKLDDISQVKDIKTNFTYDQLMGLKFKVLPNAAMFEDVNGQIIDQSKNKEYMANQLENGIEIKVVGIVMSKNASGGFGSSDSESGGIYYTPELSQEIADINLNSPILKKQLDNPDANILTGLPFSNEPFNFSSLSIEMQQQLAAMSPQEISDLMTRYQSASKETYESILLKLGYIDPQKPTAIRFYPKDFKSKEALKKEIDNYNKLQEPIDQIEYNDMVAMLMNSVTNIVNVISGVLVGFVSISLIVSSIMIGIITYISVLERIKEIGILRAMGASKKDIRRVFLAESMIIGFLSGVMGILITHGLNVILNQVIGKITGVQQIASLPYNAAIILIIISVILTSIAGFIPAQIAASKDPVKALRSE